MVRRKKVSNQEVITVTLLPLGGEVKEVAIPKDSSVKDALLAGGYSENSKTEVRSNGEILSETDIIEDGESLVISSAGKIEGGK